MHFHSVRKNVLEYKILFGSFLLFCHFWVAWLCSVVQRLNHPVKFDIASNTIIFQVTLYYVNNIVFNIIRFIFLPFRLCQNNKISHHFFQFYPFQLTEIHWIYFVFRPYRDLLSKIFCTEGMIGIWNIFFFFFFFFYSERGCLVMTEIFRGTFQTRN